MMTRAFWGAWLLLLTLPTHLLLAQQPPIPQYDVPFQAWQYNNNSCRTYVSASSSTICIPKNAIVDVNGKLVTGTITIRYREFETPMDMVLGGLQMTAKEGRHDIQLESSGMFQIEATKGNQQLYLAEGKQIDIKLRTFNPLPGDRLWQYDKNGNFWKPLAVPIQRKEEPLQDADNQVLWGQTVVSQEEDWAQEQDFEMGEFWMEGDVDWDAPVSSADSNSTWFKRRELTKRVFNTLGIQEFGIYNCDRELGEENERVPMIANLRIDGVQSDETKTVYIVFEGLNTVIYASEYYLKNSFYLLNNRSWRIFSILNPNEVAMYTSADFAPKRIDNFRGRQCDFRLHKLNASISSDDDLRNALSLR